VRLRFVPVLCLAGLAAGPSAANAPPPPLSESLIGPSLVEEMRKLFTAEVVVMSLRGANLDRKDMRQDEIDAYDKTWRKERESEAKPLITSTLTAPLSNYATRIQAHSGGLITEIIVVGLKGLNVGESTITSDMWQGDEAKFQRTVGVGPGAVFIDAAEFNEDTGTWRAQLNMTIDDPDSGAPLGAATIKINLTELDRRLKR
jgi:hypothetical protein